MTKIDTPSLIIYIKISKNLLAIDLMKILYIESLDNYVKIHFKNSETIVHNKNLKYWEKNLSNYHFFIRIHQSFSINFNHVKKITGNRVLINEKNIPVGRTFKKSFLNYINHKKII